MSHASGDGGRVAKVLVGAPGESLGKLGAGGLVGWLLVERWSFGLVPPGVLRLPLSEQMLFRGIRSAVGSCFRGIPRLRMLPGAGATFYRTRGRGRRGGKASFVRDLSVRRDEFANIDGTKQAGEYDGPDRKGTSLVLRAKTGVFYEIHFQPTKQRLSERRPTGCMATSPALRLLPMGAAGCPHGWTVRHAVHSMGAVSPANGNRGSF